MSDEDAWKQVKRKSKDTKVKKGNKEKSEPRVEREELEFHFDEELDQEVPTGRQNTFTNNWADMDEDDDEGDEFSDRDINKILIVTQAPSNRVPKHEGYDRTGDYTSRVKITQDLEQAINDGLLHYQEDLWVSFINKVSFNF